MKRYVFVITLLLILLPLANAVQVVEVNPNQDTEAQSSGGFFANTFGFLKEPVFWYVVIILVLVTIVGVVMFFVIRWLITFIKSRNDLYFLIKKDRIKLAKIQRRYNSKHWWKIKKNTPIRLVKIVDGKPHISRPFAYHRGDYTTNEGNIMIALNMEGKNKYLVFPETDILVIMNKEKVVLDQLDSKGNKQKVEINNIPKASEIVQFNENEILIFAESFSKVGQFLIPVIKSKDGRIIDLALPTFQSLKEVALGDYLYVQTGEFSKLAKESMNINPNVRAMTKVGDQNQQVEISSGADGL